LTIKCNYIHTAHVFVSAKLSLALDIAEDVVLVAHASAAHSAGVAAERDYYCQQGTPSLFISSLFISSLWKQLFIGEKCFLGVGGQE